MDLSRSSFSKPDTIFFKKKEDGTIVLANAEDEEFSIVELEGVSADIWEKIVSENNISHASLLAWMIETYEGDQHEIHSDLNEFLQDLISKKFLQTSP